MNIQPFKRIISYVIIFCMMIPLFLTHTMSVYAEEPEEVVINPVEYGADPTGKEDSAEAIWEAFQAAKEATDNGAAHVTVSFPKGEYHIYKDKVQKREYHTSNTNSIENPMKWIGILIEDQENFTLQGNGSLFMMHGNMMALAVVRSKNVTLEDFSWDFGVPTVTEMTVEELGTTQDGKEYVDYMIPECFPHEVDTTNKTIVWYSEKSPYTNEYYWTQTGIHNPSYGIGAYQPEGEMARSYFTYDSPFANVSRIEEIDDTHVRIVYNSKTSGMREMQKEGAVIQFAANAHRQTAGAFTWESENVTADHVNVHYMHGFGWLIQMSKDVYYRNCNLVPREGSGHMVVSFADGIHASGAAGDLVIEDCNFSDTHDDPINLHGTFTRVEQRKDAHTLVLKYIHTQQGGFPQYHEGDKVAFFTRDTLESTDGETLYTVDEVISNPGESGNDDLRTMEVRFTEELPQNLTDKIGSEPKYVAENVTYAPKVEIRGCTFRNVPTRGILCTTRNKVLIEDNIFYGMTMATIYLSNDSDEWYESGPIRDMTIKNNTFYIKTIGRTSWEYAPAVYVHPVTKGSGLPSEDNPIHKNITIEGNTFYMDTDTVVKAESVENLTIRNNKIWRMDPDITLAISAEKNRLLAGDRLTLQTEADGDTHTQITDNVYEFTKCKNVRLENNTYDDGLKRYAVLDGMSEKNLTNLDSDIKIASDRSQPASSPVEKIEYISSNPEVLSVDQYGKMTAVKAGTASVYACYRWDGEQILSNKVEITVEDTVSSEEVVTIQDQGEISLTEAEATHQFQAETESGKSIAWSVEDFLTGGSTDAAVIDSSGLLTAKKSGIIWVKADAGLSTARKAVVISIPDTEELASGFTIKREDSSNYTITKNEVTIDMQAGDLYNDNNTLKNLFLYRIPDNISKDNLRTVIKVNRLPVKEDGQWDTASFLLYKDDDNYISCGKKSHFDGIATVEETNQTAVETHGNTAQNQMTTAYLGFYKNGSAVSVDFKEEGGAWQHVRDITADMLGDDFQIGFSAWETNDRGRDAAFSEFYIGEGTLSYEELCGREAVSFLEKGNRMPEASGAAWDKDEYTAGETAHVTYRFLDADGDLEGETLFCISYEDGFTEVVNRPDFVLSHVGKAVCDVYPVDAKGGPGTKASTAEVTVKEPEIPVTPITPQTPVTPQTPNDPSTKPGTGQPGVSAGKTLPPVGTMITKDGILYTVTKSDANNKEAKVIRLTEKKKKLTIPSSVEKDGCTFLVTEIAEKAFQKNKQLKNVVIGANIKKIGASAFFRCSNLRKIKFQSKAVPSIGKKALKKISAKCKIIYPKKISAKQLKKWKKKVKAAR